MAKKPQIEQFTETIRKVCDILDKYKNQLSSCDVTIKVVSTNPNLIIVKITPQGSLSIEFKHINTVQFESKLIQFLNIQKAIAAH